MGEQAILARVRRWARARNGLRAGLAAVAAVLGAAVAGRWTGADVPLHTGLAVPGLALLGAMWPLGERTLLRAGRRLGVGERFAALDVLSRRGSGVLLRLLHAEIVAARPPLWRLVAGPVEYGVLALVVGLALAGLFAPPVGVRSGAVAFPTPDGDLVGTVPGPEPTAEAVGPQLAQELTVYPSLAEVPTYSPYPDLLAAVLGLASELGGMTGEEVVARLAAEEGLLRQLAEGLAAAAPGGLTPAERAQLAPLAREVARPDLRSRLEDLLGQGDEGAAREAARAVEAVREAADRARGGGDQVPSEVADLGSSTGSGVTTSDPGEDDNPSGARANLSDVEGGDPFAGGEDEFGLPGLAGGVPFEPGPPGEWSLTPSEEDPALVRGEEGPLRAYIVRGIPGEPLPGPPSEPAALSPQEVEVVLRTRGVPPELRDLVRRYFELIGGNP